MNNYPIFQTSTQFKAIMDSSLADVCNRIDAFGFTVWPFGGSPDHNIPPGFCTIGMTNVGLPEVYISGIMPYSTEGNALVTKLKKIYEYAMQDPDPITAEALCIEVSELQKLEEVSQDYQWRPVDPTRLLYGQATMLRYWADAKGVTDKVTGVQVVKRDASGEFPYVSSGEQLLLDYVPYGTPVQTLEVN